MRILATRAHAALALFAIELSTVLVLGCVQQLRIAASLVDGQGFARSPNSETFRLNCARNGFPTRMSALSTDDEHLRECAILPRPRHAAQEARGLSATASLGSKDKPTHAHTPLPSCTPYAQHLT